MVLIGFRSLFAAICVHAASVIGHSDSAPASCPVAEQGRAGTEPVRETDLTGVRAGGTSGRDRPALQGSSIWDSLRTFGKIAENLQTVD